MVSIKDQSDQSDIQVEASWVTTLVFFTPAVSKGFFLSQSLPSFYRVKLSIFALTFAVKG